MLIRLTSSRRYTSEVTNANNFLLFESSVSRIKCDVFLMHCFTSVLNHKFLTFCNHCACAMAGARVSEQMTHDVTVPNWRLLWYHVLSWGYGMLFDF
jgi:hypothetical protein